MNIIVRVITGVIQDNDSGLYDNVTIVYVVLAACSIAVSLLLLLLSWRSSEIGHLQWTRKQRIARGSVLNECKRKFYEEKGHQNRRISLSCFGACMLLLLGS